MDILNPGQTRIVTFVTFTKAGKHGLSDIRNQSHGEMGNQSHLTNCIKTLLPLEQKNQCQDFTAAIIGNNEDVFLRMNKNSISCWY